MNPKTSDKVLAKHNSWRLFQLGYAFVRTRQDSNLQLSEF